MMDGRQLVYRQPTVEATTREPEVGQRASLAAIEDAAALLGRRWKLGILCLLARGRYRYNAMMRELPGATPKMLTQQLRALEEAGLVVRFEYTGGAKHTEYALTPVGESFVPIVDALSEWVGRYWMRERGLSSRRDLEREVPIQGRSIEPAPTTRQMNAR